MARGRPLIRLINKIQAGISPAALQLLLQLDDWVTALTPAFNEYNRLHETIEILREAVQRRRSVEIQYHPS